MKTMARKHPGEIWKIEDLLQTIKTEVEAREASNVIKSMSLRSNPTPRTQNPTASSLVASSQVPKCVYCDGDHYPSACTTIQSVKDRRTFLLRAGRCFNCLRPQHCAKDCESSKKRRLCRRKHHQSICEKATVPNLSDRPTRATEPVETTAITSNTAKGSKLVLLQTARALASNDTGSKSVNVRILFDTGSQRSYVTDSLVRQLNLKPQKREKLQLNTFGEPGFKGRNCDIVNIQLQKASGREWFKLQALRFPTICSSLPNSISLERFPSLLKLDLADPPSSSPEGIDVLIGSDYYWNLVEEEIVRTDNGPTVVKSKFGWLLSGPLATSNPPGTTVTHLSLCRLPDTVAPEVDGLTDILKSFWETKSLGIKEEPVDSETNTEPFLTNVRFVKERYEVGLPWLRERNEVPTHYNLCFNRLKYLQRRLIKEPDILREYQRLLNDQLSHGIIEQVTDSGSSSSDKNCIHFCHIIL